MLSVQVRDNIDDVVRQLAGRRDQIPFATAKALTATAQLIRDAEYREMASVFDRPKPYTLNSLYLRAATKANPTAVVWLKEDTGQGVPADKYLNPQIKGGFRSLKRFELALHAVGALPADYKVVPGAAAKMDAYGNIDPGLITSILSYFKAFPEQGYKANITDKRRAKLRKGTKKTVGFEYFVGAPGDGKLPLGIWQRFHLGHGTAIKPIMIFVSAVHYSILFKFFDVAERVYTREFGDQFAKAFADANATAR